MSRSTPPTNPRPSKKHRQSVRLRGHDYAGGLYFVTICTGRRRPLFGDVVRGVMRPTEAGRIAREEWHRTGELRPDVVLDAFVVMPNHVHALIGIAPDDDGSDTGPTGRRGTARCAPTPGGAAAPDSNDAPDATTPSDSINAHNSDDATDFDAPRGFADSPGPGNPPRLVSSAPPTSRRFGAMTPRTLPAIVRAYKSAVTRRARAVDPAFAWQRGYHEHVVRDAAARDRIRRYIAANPARWSDDRYHVAP